MAFPTNSGKRTLATELELVQLQAASLKRFCTQARDSMAAGPVPSELVISVLSLLRTSRDVFLRVREVPGIGTYVQEQFADATFDVVAEFDAMAGAIDGAIAWIATNIPKTGGSNTLQIQTINTSTGETTWVTFTSADTASLRTELDSVIASID